jgi:hypothetical protein
MNLELKLERCFMTMNWIKSFALTAAVSAVIPTMAKADGFHREDRDHRDIPTRVYRDTDRYHSDRDDDRYASRDEVRYSREEVRYPREEFRRTEIRVEPVRSVELCDIPSRVLDRVNDYRHGRRIESAQVSCIEGRDVYQFRIEDRNGDFRLDIEPSGHLLGRY